MRATTELQRGTRSIANIPRAPYAAPLVYGTIPIPHFTSLAVGSVAPSRGFVPKLQDRWSPPHTHRFYKHIRRQGAGRTITETRRLLRKHNERLSSHTTNPPPKKESPSNQEPRPNHTPPRPRPALGSYTQLHPATPSAHLLPSSHWSEDSQDNQASRDSQATDTSAVDARDGRADTGDRALFYCYQMLQQLRRARGVAELLLLLRGEAVEHLLERRLAQGVLPDAQSLALVLLVVVVVVVSSANKQAHQPHS